MNKEPNESSINKEHDKQCIENGYHDNEVLNNTSVENDENISVRLHYGHRNENDNVYKDKDDFYKPREEYLKHTIGEMNVSKQLSSAIEHGMFDTLLDIKRNFMANEGGLLQQGLPFSSSVPSIFLHSHPVVSSTSKTRLHLIKELKQNEQSLQTRIQKLINNKEALEDESNFNLSSKHANSNEEAVRKIEIKNINKEKELLTDRLLLITSKIEQQIEEEKTETGITKSKIRSNLLQLQHNLETNTNPTIFSLKQLQKESDLRQQKRLNDFNEKLALKINQIEEIEKKEKEMKLNRIVQLKQGEREIIEKRKRNQSERQKQIGRIEVKDKKAKAIRTYAYIDLSNRYVLSEKLLLQKEKIKRKEHMKSIKQEDFKAFEHNYDINRKKLSIELLSKGDKLLELWKQRSQLLPNYINPIVKKASDEGLLLKAKQEERQEKIQRYLIQKQQYGEILTQPKPNMALRMRRMKNISNLNIKLILHNKKVVSPNNSSTEARGEEVGMERDSSMPILHKANRHKSKPHDITNDNVNVNDSGNGNAQSFDHHKPKRLFIKLNQKSNIKIKLIKPLDFLEEQRKKKKRINHWNTMIVKEKKKSSVINGILHVKNRVETIDEKIQRYVKLLRFNGGVKEHPDINDEVNGLLISSIKGKLSILNTLFP